MPVVCRLAENFDLEEPVWTISLFSSAHRLFSNSSPQSNAPLLSRCRKTQRKIYRTKADTNRPVTYTRTHTRTHSLPRTMAEEYKVYFKSMRKRKDVELGGQSSRKVDF